MSWNLKNGTLISNFSERDNTQNILWDIGPFNGYPTPNGPKNFFNNVYSKGETEIVITFNNGDQISQPFNPLLNFEPRTAPNSYFTTVGAGSIVGNQEEALTTKINHNGIFQAHRQNKNSWVKFYPNSTGFFQASFTFFPPKPARLSYWEIGEVVFDFNVYQGSGQLWQYGFFDYGTNSFDELGFLGEFNNTGTDWEYGMVAYTNYFPTSVDAETGQVTVQFVAENISEPLFVDMVGIRIGFVNVAANPRSPIIINVTDS